ncbi:putative Late nodulin [Medicago truncatula]|uniref:Nodule Cysteine-Rich (NCR) secreted peptide n=1 Tax=Medicago truncatula TaxID=3880 RepID=A7KHD7_MEDTR|nr:nodule-specific cysteine-rich peptide 301 [Medicago truncatula]AES68838.1 Nodule Cysteine-Rich (NCR) secreted peptide [Medicago truncatula]AFK40576.1 unknown [Medicago truncatula]RHN65732.1 putative Late nodulin [Medicago truncatula]
MAHKLVYAITLFIFLFLIANNIEDDIFCITDNDCPPNTLVQRYRCINGKCNLSFVSYG